MYLFWTLIEYQNNKNRLLSRLDYHKTISFYKKRSIKFYIIIL
jgi:hypothetical protein